MIKTIKVKKKLRLDELIKYAWDNQLNKTFTSDKGLKKIIITQSSIDFRSLDNGIVSSHDTFTVEVEEEITESTVFNTLVDVNNNDEVHTTRNVSIGLYAKEQTKEIHALVNGKLELIWEAK